MPRFGSAEGRVRLVLRGDRQSDRRATGRRGPRRARGLHGASLVVVAAIACGALSPAASCHAQTAADAAANPEYNVKAAFLYSFGRYVEWPADAFSDAGGAFVIGVLGSDPFGGALERIAATKKIQERTIVVRRLKSLDDYKPPCHILFVPRTVPPEQQTAAIQKVQGTPVLVVGESAGFARAGATVNFYLDQETIRFEINVAAAKAQRLTINAKLLSLGTLVKGN
jgi:hypothetical protein